MKRVLFVIEYAMKTFNVFLFLLFCLFDLSIAIPRRGNEPWSLILCKFADLPRYEPRPKEWFEQWFNGPEPGMIYFTKCKNK